MRIKTQFIITMLLFGIILIALAASAIITNQIVEKASQQERIASSIAQGASELSYLSNDYLIYRESQQLTRWQSSFASLSNQVASLHVDKPEQQLLVRNIKANQQRLEQVFDSVVSAVGGLSQKRSSALDLAFLQVSWSRMAVQSQGLTSDASRLSQLLHQRRDLVTITRTILIYFMVGLFGVFLLVSYMFTYRRILKSIVKLQAGAAVIGSGNLDFVIREKKNDEVGDLSHAFNQMTTNLKAVTASKADLETEIVERKKAEEELRRQREWLRVTLSSIGDAVIASDTQGRITFLNPVAATSTGWHTEEAIGQPIHSVFRIINEKTREPAEDLLGRVLGEKRVVGLANDTALLTKDGREIPIEDSAAPIIDSTGNVIGVVLVFHDIIEKRRTQAALHEAHERAVWLARFPEQNPNPVIRASADGTILYCNPSTTKFAGWRCEVGEVLQNELLPLVGRAMGEGREVQQDLQLDGRVYIVWITPFPIEGYANIYGRDITERKLHEQRIVRLTKLYAVLSRVNETIVRTYDEERLYKEVCRIIAEEGEFPLVWVGQVKERQVAPVAFHGPATDYLKEIRVEVEGELGSGPTGTCIREGRLVVNKDFDTNPSAAPWRKPALHYGFRASAAFPVRRQGRVVSALTLYSPEPGVFDSEQVNLLEALCADISYALEAMQQEKLRTEAENALRQRTLELKRLTETLEQEVQTRTEELEVANEELKVEIDQCQRVEIELRKSEKDLRQLSVEILNAQEKERKLVAGEIHDSIGSSLSAIKFKVETALTEVGNKSPETASALQTVIPIVQGAIDEARRIQMNLRPSILDDLGILATIKWFCRQFESTYSKIRVKQNINIDEHDVPDSLKTVIFRILQEGLNNIAKHSGTEMVFLSLLKRDRAIKLMIRDYGQGFDLSKLQSPDGAARGLGLKNMRERAELAGGSLVIESTERKGTTIRVSWPI